MASLNKTQLIGHLGANPEQRFLPSGKTTTTISLATTETWKDKETLEKKERTEWHRVVFFGSLADVVVKYLRSGSLIYVEGKLRTRKWVDTSGAERYTTEIIADEMKMLGGKSGDNEHIKTPPNNDAPPPVDDDIPF